MLMLLFSVGNSQFAIPAREVVEVAPLVRLDMISMAPAYVAGLFNYRGKHVPVLDLCQLVLGRPCEDSITSRIILVVLNDMSGDQHTLGLLAERITETTSLEPSDFSSTGVAIPDAPYLDKAAHTESGFIQQVRIAALLPEPVRALLFPAETV